MADFDRVTKLGENAMFTINLNRWIGRGSRSRRPQPISDEARWAEDPLSHPVLKAMNARELADIPFPRMRAELRAAARCSSR